MDQHHKGGTRALLLIIILCLFFIFVSTFGDDQVQKSFDHEQKQEQEVKKSACEMMKSTFALYTSSPWSPATSYLDKLKTFFNQAQAYFFPPNLDFSASKEAEEMKERSGGEKIKEAAAKTLERSKESVEESAKTAAQIAGYTIQKTKAKVKKTFSPEL